MYCPILFFHSPLTAVKQNTLLHPGHLQNNDICQLFPAPAADQHAYRPKHISNQYLLLRYHIAETSKGASRRTSGNCLGTSCTAFTAHLWGKKERYFVGLLFKCNATSGKCKKKTMPILRPGSDYQAFPSRTIVS